MKLLFLKYLRSIFLAAVLSLLSLSHAFAQSNWTGANSDDWLDPGNWSAGVPDNTDNTTISAVGGFANDTLISADGMETATLYIGNLIGESGLLTITTGGLTSSYVFLGDGGDGQLIVTTSSSLAVNADTYVGYDSGAGGGTGILDVLDGSSLTAGNQFYIGANSTGTLNISNSTVGIGGFFNIGAGNSGASGTMSITNGGFLSSGTTWITEGFGSQATIRVNGAGSEWDSSGTIYMGASNNFIADGDSTIIVENGGKVSAVNTYVGIRGFTGPHLVTITDAGSEWVTSSNFYVGFGTGFIDNQV